MYAASSLHCIGVVGGCVGLLIIGRRRPDTDITGDCVICVGVGTGAGVGCFEGEQSAVTAP